nr:MAG TPA: hypothetical protein [Caudoviricetes sp.]
MYQYNYETFLFFSVIVQLTTPSCLIQYPPPVAYKLYLKQL